MIPLLHVLDFINFGITDFIDILLVGLILYQLYRWVRGTAAVRIFISLLVIFTLWKLVSLFHLDMLSDIIGEFISVGMIFLIVVFQPEIRKFLIYVGNTRFLKWVGRVGKKEHLNDYINEINNISRACRRMAASKTGALIIVARETPLDDFLNTGEPLDALVSRELLENIFFKNSPLHDGAVIIKQHRIAAARCILPVSKSDNIPTDLGLRHRSAIGSTTMTDALAIIVSEQTGQISLCKEGNIQRDLSPSFLKQILIEELTNDNRYKSEDKEDTKTSKE